MILSLALDGFDNPFGGCTTHLASLIAVKLVREGYHLVDYPWLIRLNPVVPWKTRGNGAAAIHLHVDSIGESTKIAQTALKLAQEYSGAEKACLIAVVWPNLSGLRDLIDHITRTPLRTLYAKAVSTQVSIVEAQEVLRELKRYVVAAWGSKRGLIGALASLGADLEYDYTFELLTYRHPKLWGKPRNVDIDTIIEFDLRTSPYTFLNYDYENRRPLITPHGLDPVLFGVRGEYPETLLKALDVIRADESPTHFTIFRTNQATDAHIKMVKPISMLRVYDCTEICGIVRRLRVLPGPHIAIDVCDNTNCITAMVYRETGKLLRAVQHLKEGDAVCIRGCVKQHKGTLSFNVEKIYACIRERIHTIKPRCPICGSTLKSKGRNTLYCDNCHREFYDLLPKYEQYPGFECKIFEPSPAAFHHLMMPIQRSFIRKPRGITLPSTPILEEFTSM